MIAFIPNFWNIIYDTDCDELENRLSFWIERPQRNMKWNVQATVIIADLMD